MRYVGLLRGVNVGGGNKVPMADLRALCADLGWRDVQTYIASGNLVFATDDPAQGLSSGLRKAMADRMNVDVPVMILDGQTLKQTLEDCPFDPASGNQVHCAFLLANPAFDANLYQSRKTPSEEIVIRERTAWIHTPDGFGRSKLVERLPKVLGADFTARNLNTIRKLVEMLDG